MNEKIQTTPTNSGSAVSATIAAGVERFTKTAHNGIDTASQAAHPVIDRLASDAHKALDNADDVALQAKQALDKAGIKSEELVAASSSYMRAHPLITLGLAIAAGYMLSRMMATR